MSELDATPALLYNNSRPHVVRHRETSMRDQAEMKRVRVKFCGGCNPHIDRGLAYKKIEELASAEGITLTTEEGAEADLLLILDGCPTSCTYSEGNFTNGTVVKISGESVNMEGVEESDIAEEAVKAIVSHLST